MKARLRRQWMNYSLPLLGSLLLLTALSPLWAQGAPDVYHAAADFRTQPPLTLGAGITTNDLYTRRAPALNNFVPSTGGVWKTINPNAAQAAQIKIYRATRREDILRAMGWDLNIAAQGANWNADLQVGYSERSLTRTNSLTFVISAQVDWGLYGMTNPENWLLPSAISMFHSNFLQFGERYGERLITDVAMGQSLSVVLQLNNLDEELYQQLNVSASAGYSALLYDLSFGATFSKALKQARENSELRIDVFASGGDPSSLANFVVANAGASDLVNNMNAAIRTYITNNFVRELSVPTAYYTTRFRDLIPPLPADKPQDFYNRERDDFLAHLAAFYYDAKDTQNELIYYLSQTDGALLTPNQFDALSAQLLLYEQYKNDLLAKHQQIKQQMLAKPASWVTPLPPLNLLTVDQMYLLNYLPSPTQTVYSTAGHPQFDNPSGPWEYGLLGMNISENGSDNPGTNWLLFNVNYAPGRFRLPANHQGEMFINARHDYIIISCGREGPDSSTVKWVAPAKGRWKITYRVRGWDEASETPPPPPGLRDYGGVMYVLRENGKIESQQVVPIQDYGVFTTPVTRYVRLRRNEPLYFRYQHNTSSPGNYFEINSEAFLDATIEWAPVSP